MRGGMIHRYCKLCELEDFADPELLELMREAFAVHAERFGRSFPAGVEYRKYWEVAMTLRALRDFGVSEGDVATVGAVAETVRDDVLNR